MRAALPSLPPLQLASTTSSTSGDIAAPNTVYFGSFGGGTDIIGLIRQYWPLLLAGGLAVAILRKKGG